MVRRPPRAPRTGSSEPRPARARGRTPQSAVPARARRPGEHIDVLEMSERPVDDVDRIGIDRLGLASAAARATARRPSRGLGGQRRRGRLVLITERIELQHARARRTGASCAWRAVASALGRSSEVHPAEVLECSPQTGPVDRRPRSGHRDSRGHLGQRCAPRHALYLDRPRRMWPSGRIEHVLDESEDARGSVGRQSPAPIVSRASGATSWSSRIEAMRAVEACRSVSVPSSRSRPHGS